VFGVDALDRTVSKFDNCDGVSEIIGLGGVGVNSEIMENSKKLLGNPFALENSAVWFERVQWQAFLPNFAGDFALAHGKLLERGWIVRGGWIPLLITAPLCPTFVDFLVCSPTFIRILAVFVGKIVVIVPALVDYVVCNFSHG
jgi:hypothetical protein